jgi:hypothetical protein
MRGNRPQIKNYIPFKHIRPGKVKVNWLTRIIAELSNTRRHLAILMKNYFNINAIIDDNVVV